MKTTFCILLLILNFQLLNAQTTTNSNRSSLPIEMLFLEGKTKALILSYDDGRIEDRRLVKLMNKYKLIGTFHLNSNKLGTSDYLNKAEIKELFDGHEVSVHTFNHPNLSTLSEIDIVYEVIEDRKELEKLMEYPIRGMAYPFGNNDDAVIEAIKDLGIEYARTVDDTYNFNIPANFLKWHPTIHQFSKTYWKPNDNENDTKELALFYTTIKAFLETKDLAVLDVWGHSWEMGNDEAKWNETENFFKMIANNPAIHYTTQIDIVDYMNAYKNLKFSVDKSFVFNLSSVTVFFKFNGKTYTSLGGKTMILN